MPGRDYRARWMGIAGATRSAKPRNASLSRKVGSAEVADNGDQIGFHTFAQGESLRTEQTD